MSDYLFTSGDRPLGFLYLPGWVFRVPYFWGGTRVLSTNHWLKKSIWCMPHATTLVFAFLLAERRRCRYETLLQWREHLHRYSMLQTSATLHCPEVLVSNRKIWAAITLFPLTISRQPARTLVTNLLRAGKTGVHCRVKTFHTIRHRALTTLYVLSLLSNQHHLVQAPMDYGDRHVKGNQSTTMGLFPIIDVITLYARNVSVYFVRCLFVHVY